jgi:hypothetical protein
MKPNSNVTIPYICIILYPQQNEENIKASHKYNHVQVFIQHYIQHYS